MNPADLSLISGAVMAGLLLVSAFFSSAETALFSIPPESARRLRNQAGIGEILGILKQDPSGLLTAILFGNLVVNVLFFSTGAAFFSRMALTPWMEAAGGGCVLLAVIIFGEILPKAAGAAHPAGILRLTALPLRVWFCLVRPFRRLTGRLLGRLGTQEPASAVSRPGLTPAELRELMDALTEEPGFGSHEKEILEDILTLSEIRVREVMVPRVRVFRRTLQADRDEILRQGRLQRSDDVLICRGSDEEPLGFLSIRDLFLNGSAEGSLEPFVRAPLYVPETKRADVLLRELLEKDLETAVVVDEYGGLAGVVSLQDLLAEVVADAVPAQGCEVEWLDGGSCRLSGQLPIRAWCELLAGFLPGHELESLAFETLGGFFISLYGRIPRPGDQVQIRNLQLTVETMLHRRIGTIRLTLLPGQEALR